MSLSDCEKCWDTPCTCGWEYRNWTNDEKIKLCSAILKVPEEKMQPKTNEIDEILSERKTTYGDWLTQAKIAVELKDVFQKSPNWKNLHPVYKESLDMIANKISRILNGDPHYADSWNDIAGYAKIAEQRIEFIRGCAGF